MTFSNCLGFCSTCARSLTFYGLICISFLYQIYYLYVLLQTFLSVNQTAVSKHDQFHLYPMEDLGGAANQTFGADLRRRRKAMFISNHALGLLARRTSAESLGMQDFLLRRPCLFLLSNEKTCSGHSLPSGVWASMWTKSGSLSRPETDLGEKWESTDKYVIIMNKQGGRVAEVALCRI